MARRGLPAQVTRVAAVDLGTNTTRLLVADVEDGRVDEIVRAQRITRLGEDVTRGAGCCRCRSRACATCSTDYRRELESLGAERVLAVATSAVRDAENGEAFLGEVEWSYGFATRLLSGEEEAALTLRGVGDVSRRHARVRRRRRLDRADPRRQRHEPRRRLGAADGALRRGRRLDVGSRASGCCRTCGRQARSASRHRHDACGARPRPRGVRPRPRARPRVHARRRRAAARAARFAAARRAAPAAGARPGPRAR